MELPFSDLICFIRENSVAAEADVTERLQLKLSRCLVAVLVPSAPRRLRAFVTSLGGGDVTRQVLVDLRWSRPAEPGGIISSYHVLMANTMIGDDSWNVTTLAGEQLANKFSLVVAPINTILYFKVSKISQFSFCL